MVWISGFGFVRLSIECRRMFSGNESVIHARRKCGGNHFDRLSNRQLTAERVVIKISRRAIESREISS
jgi:hypothetical protein